MASFSSGKLPIDTKLIIKAELSRMQQLSFQTLVSKFLLVSQGCFPNYVFKKIKEGLANGCHCMLMGVVHSIVMSIFFSFR